ncbi:hypothetical protein LTS12_027734 [Elasticomyces elasticus]|nr:hypothetical protein LTS12_027734 [Elasticomyces elasticus]
MYLQSTVLAVLLSATHVAAHGHVTNIVANGVYYEGFDIDSFPYMSDPPAVAAWTTPNTGNGFLTPDDYSSSDIICHQNATNAKGHVTVKAGDRVNVQWTAWPDSHHGPVMDYLADCGDSCETVDKTKLEFFKVDGVGLVDDAKVPGTWGDDQLIKNNNSWMVEIPKSIAPGNYVLRHELMAMHGAQSKGGAQNYPQCFNLKVTGSGTDKPKGTLGTELYTPTGPGIIVNIYESLSSYHLPGPATYSGATSISQTSSVVTSTGSATVGSGSAAASATSSGSASAASMSMPAARKNVAMPSISTIAVRVPVASPSSSSAGASTPAGSSSALPSSSSGTVSSSAAGAAQSAWGQCGGVNYSGSKACGQGSRCSSINPYYHQCAPTAA